MSKIHYTKCTKCKQYAVLNLDGKVVGCEHCKYKAERAARPDFGLINQPHVGEHTAQVVPQ